MRNPIKLSPKGIINTLDKISLFYRLHRFFQITGGNLMFYMISRQIVFRNKQPFNKVALFYPESPKNRSMLRRLIRILGYNISTDPKKIFNFAVFWSTKTYKEYDLNLETIAAKQQLLNYQCTDISKSHVNAVFKQVFRYGMDVNPLRFSGLCVKKGNENALHDGATVMCPITEVEEGFVYHLLINNQANEHEVEDIRVPIIGDRIPFVYLKFRPLQNRFASHNNRVIVTPTEQALTKDEVDNIICLCQKLGLEYGELDVLRDRSNGRIYIVDANNTPGGPPNQLSRKQQMKALQILAQNFQEVFIEHKYEQLNVINA